MKQPRLWQLSNMAFAFYARKFLKLIHEERFMAFPRIVVQADAVDEDVDGHIAAVPNPRSDRS